MWGGVGRMDYLRQILESPGIPGFETFIASGYVLFETELRGCFAPGKCRNLLQHPAGSG